MPPNSSSEWIENRNRSSRGKLNRVIDEYDFEGLGERLETDWLSESDDRSSLRELAEYVNHCLLRTRMRDAGMDPLDGEVENTYRLLTADDVSAGTCTQTRRHLQRAGIDVETLETDFVSRQAVHTYLTKDRGVSYDHNKGDPAATEATTINGFKRRLTATIHSKLERLRNLDAISIGEFEVLLNVRVLCKDCGAQYPVSEFLKVRTCECVDDA